MLTPLHPLASSTLFRSIFLFFPLLLSFALLTPSLQPLPAPSMLWSQERVHRVPHTLLHRFSSSLERPPALHPLRRVALSKIQPFLGRSTNRRQLTKASYVSVSSTTRFGPPFFCVASRVPGLFFISSSSTLRSF